MFFGCLVLIVWAGCAIVVSLRAGGTKNSAVTPEYLIVSPDKRLVLGTVDVQTVLTEERYEQIRRCGKGMFLISPNGIATLSFQPLPKTFFFAGLSLSREAIRRYAAIIIVQDDVVRERLRALAEKFHEEHIARTTHPRLYSGESRDGYIITSL
jgi:hypothetical protein